jgi:hypothetical protein
LTALGGGGGGGIPAVRPDGGRGAVARLRVGHVELLLCAQPRPRAPLWLVVYFPAGGEKGKNAPY